MLINYFYRWLRAHGWGWDALIILTCAFVSLNLLVWALWWA